MNNLPRITTILLLVVVVVVLVVLLLVAAVSPSSAGRPPIEGLPSNETRKLSEQDFNAAIDRFHTWFAEHYGEKVLVKVAPVPGARLGVVALQKFRKGDPYLKVPLKMCIDGNTIASSSSEHAPPQFKEFWNWLRHQSQQPHYQRSHNTRSIEMLLASFLIYARYVAPNSTFWSPYIDLLPRQLSTPEHSWTDNDISCLNGHPRIRNTIRGYRQRREHEFRWLQEHLFTKPKKQAASGGGGLPFDVEALLPEWALTRAHWSWAMGILGTRMIWWDGGPHLVPMLDMVNCDAGPELQDGPRRHVHETVREGDRAVTRAGWLIHSTNEISENYGQHNAYYLMNHGFYLDYNPHDCYFVELPPITRELTRKALFLVTRPSGHNSREMFDQSTNEICFSITDRWKMNFAIDIARIYTLPDRVLEQAILKRELPAKDSDRQTRRVLRFIGKSVSKAQKQLYLTQKLFSDREWPVEDAPHKEMISEYTEAIGLQMDDALRVLRKRVRVLSTRIDAKVSENIRNEISEAKKEAEKEMSAEGDKKQNNDNDDGPVDDAISSYHSIQAKKKEKQKIRNRNRKKIDDQF